MKPPSRKDRLYFGSLAVIISFLIFALIISSGGYRQAPTDRVQLAAELHDADRAVAGVHRGPEEGQGSGEALSVAEGSAGGRETGTSVEALPPVAAVQTAEPEDAAEEEDPPTLLHAEELSRETFPVRTVLASRDGQEKEINLPDRFGPLPEGTPVTLTFQVIPGRARDILMKFAGTPCQVYINEVLFYEGGAPGTFPSMLKDPPAELLSLPLPDTDLPVDVRIELTSPSSSKNLMLFSPVVGTEEAILRHLLKTSGISLILAMVFLISGVFLMILSIGFLVTENRGTLLRLSGLFALCAGIWLFSGNDLALFLIRQPALMHLASYIGMYFLTIPLYLFSIRLLDLDDSRVLKICLAALQLGAALGLLLQVTGTVPFSRSSYFFAGLIFASLSVLTGFVLKEALSGHDTVNICFFFSLLILLLSMLLYWFGAVRNVSGQLSLVYEAGFILFFVLMLLISSKKMGSLYSLKAQNVRLQDELRLMEKVIDAQKARNRMLVEHANAVKEQRHDLRHHLNVMKVLLDEGKPEELSSYLDNLTSQIPVDRSVTYCDHEVANALLSYYASLAAAEKIQLEIHAQIPDRTPEISDDSLCVIIGNLLENAVESCRRMTGGRRFIRFNTKAQGDMLFIAQDNSYEKEPAKREGYFLSSKRDEVGTGLLSVQSVAERYGGKAYFEAKDGRFRSEVYVHM